MAAMPFTISLARRHSSSRRPRPMTMGDVISFTDKSSLPGNRARAQVHHQVHRRRLQPTNSGRFGFNVLASNKRSNTNAVVPLPIVAKASVNTWNLNWDTPMGKYQKAKSDNVVAPTAPKYCKYCKENGHRIYEVDQYGQKQTTCPLLIQKDEHRARAVASKKAAKKAATSAKKARAERRLVAQIAVAQDAKVEHEVIEDIDSDASEDEDFPALPTLESRGVWSQPQVRTTFADKVMVKQYVKGSPPNKLHSPLVEQVEDAAPQITVHEKQDILNQIATLEEELDVLQRYDTRSWADAGDEEDLLEEIAVLEARLR